MSTLIKEFKENYESMINKFDNFNKDHSFLSAGFDYGSGAAMIAAAMTLGTLMSAPVLTTIVAPIIALTTLVSGGILPGAISKRLIVATCSAGKAIKDNLPPKQNISTTP